MSKMAEGNAPNGPPPIFGLLVGLVQWTAKTYFSGLVQVLKGLPLDQSKPWTDWFN